MPSFFRLATIAALFTAALVSAVPINDSNSTSPVLQKRAGGAPVIYRCTIPGTIAITFDDGPFLYTNGLLDILRSRNVKATFFFNGNNYGRIEDFASAVKRAYVDGHQVASHTWDHKDLTTLSPGDALEELTKCKYLDFFLDMACWWFGIKSVQCKGFWTDTETFLSIVIMVQWRTRLGTLLACARRTFAHLLRP